MKLIPSLTTLALLSAAGPAAAQPTDTVREGAPISADLGSVGDHRSKAGDWMIMPRGVATLTGSMSFVTADAGIMSEGIKFTDIVLTSISARRAMTRRLELFAGGTFLPKQPSYTDELVWQSASAGARLGFGTRYAAYASASGGQLLGDRGNWVAGSAGVQSRKSLHETLLVEGGLGMAYTSLHEEMRDDPSWLTEITASGELIFREPHGMMAGWVGTEFRFPMMNDSAASMVGEAPYDPQTRVNFHLGVVLSYIPDWDIFARFGVIDRGDQVDPSTTLPILEGGFDQKQLIIGLTRRFRPGDTGRGGPYVAR